MTCQRVWGALLAKGQGVGRVTCKGTLCKKQSLGNFPSWSHVTCKQTYNCFAQWNFILISNFSLFLTSQTPSCKCPHLRYNTWWNELEHSDEGLCYNKNFLVGGSNLITGTDWCLVTDLQTAFELWAWSSSLLPLPSATRMQCCREDLRLGLTSQALARKGWRPRLPVVYLSTPVLQELVHMATPLFSFLLCRLFRELLKGSRGPWAAVIPTGKRKWGERYSYHSGQSVAPGRLMVRSVKMWHVHPPTTWAAIRALQALYILSGITPQYASQSLLTPEQQA